MMLQHIYTCSILYLRLRYIIPAPHEDEDEDKKPTPDTQTPKRPTLSCPPVPLLVPVPGPVPVPPPACTCMSTTTDGGVIVCVCRVKNENGIENEHGDVASERADVFRLRVQMAMQCAHTAVADHTEDGEACRANAVDLGVGRVQRRDGGQKRLMWALCWAHCTVHRFGRRV